MEENERCYFPSKRWHNLRISMLCNGPSDLCLVIGFNGIGWLLEFSGWSTLFSAYDMRQGLVLTTFIVVAEMFLHF